VAELTRVAFDDQIFTGQARGGVARYYTELLAALRAHPELGIQVDTPFRWVVNDHLLDHDPVHYRRAPLPAALQRAKVLRLLNQLRFGRARRRAGLLHHTHFSLEALEQPATKRICTVYDMIPELFPEYVPGDAHQAKTAYVDACDAVLCISETTRTDVLRHYGSLDKPVVATPLGVGEAFFGGRPTATRWGDYVLFLGHRFTYKDFDVALRAFARLAPAHPQLRLLCAGGPPFSPEELARLDELGIAARVDHAVPEDHELPDVYASARCFVFPTRYEGFGLPTVEAFAAGCPVVLADQPCSVEVGGEAALFFPAGDDDALAAHVERLLADEQERARCIEAGRQRAQTFTWLETARRTAAVYRELAG
jgi:glycosyltransferase involved in cell wall biosynthesis